MHSQTILALLAGFATLATSSPLTRRTTCPPFDNNNSPLLSQGLNGNFIVCQYAAARLCTYFSNGSFSSGSSVCPASISHNTNDDDGNAQNGGGGFVATCPEADDTGSVLLAASSSTDKVVCRYEQAGVCTYFTNGGFLSGSSECPDQAISEKVKARATPACDEKREEEPAAKNAGAVVERAVSCPETDNNGSPLQSSGPAPDPVGGVRCVYPQARVCTYFSNGSFSSGSSVCPQSIA